MALTVQAADADAEVAFARMLGMPWLAPVEQRLVFIDRLTGSIQGMDRREALPIGYSLVVDQDIGLG